MLIDPTRLNRVLGENLTLGEMFLGPIDTMRLGIATSSPGGVQSYLAIWEKRPPTLHISSATAKSQSFASVGVPEYRLLLPSVALSAAKASSGRPDLSGTLVLGEDGPQIVVRRPGKHPDSYDIHHVALKTWREFPFEGPLDSLVAFDEWSIVARACSDDRWTPVLESWVSTD